MLYSFLIDKYGAGFSRIQMNFDNFFDLFGKTKRFLFYYIQ